jgi:hypothetical protein
MSMQGDKGDQGSQGERGPRGRRGEGMTRGTRRAIVTLFALTVAMAVASILFTVHYVHANNQQRCTSLLADAAIPLPHPIAGNPSREWEAAFEKIAAARAHRLGC